MGILKTLTINGTSYNVTPVVPADSITLLASAWEGDDEAYSQVVEIPGVTAYTKVDLQPTAEQLCEFHNKVLAFVAENVGGVVRVYAIGDKPTDDHTIQITKTEVEGAAQIRGNTVGTTMPRPDWNQTDPTAADYIKNKPDLPSTGTDEVFTATYGETTYAELDAAYKAGKVLFCQDGNYTVPFYTVTTTGSYCFFSNDSEALTNRYCDKSVGWKTTRTKLCAEVLAALEARIQQAEQLIDDKTPVWVMISRYDDDDGNCVVALDYTYNEIKELISDNEMDVIGHLTSDSGGTYFEGVTQTIHWTEDQEIVFDFGCLGQVRLDHNNYAWFEPGDDSIIDDTGVYSDRAWSSQKVVDYIEETFLGGAW